MSKIILTGDRPTGRLHVGHYVGSLKERVRLQNSGLYDEVYIMIADAQALTDNAEHPGESSSEHYSGSAGLSGMRYRSGESNHFYPIHDSGTDGTDVLLYESGYGIQSSEKSNCKSGDSAEKV